MIRKVFGLSIAMAMCMLLTSECFAQSCSGAARRTPLRNLVAAKPVRTALRNTVAATQNVFQKVAMSRSQSCAASVQASCSGSAVQSSCAGSMTVPQSAAPSPCTCGCQEGLPCTCGSPQVGSSDYAIAKQKSDLQASTGRMRHVGGSMGSARYEGVGFSTVSPERAQQIACYYGERPLVASAVSRGANGWYATNLYN